MSILSKQPPFQQTEFGDSQMWLEDTVHTAEEIELAASRKAKSRRILFFSIGGVLILVVLVLVVQRLMQRTPQAEVVTAKPTSTPTPSVPVSPLVARIRDGKNRVEQIDTANTDLAIPQVDFTLRLDAVETR